MKEGIVKSKEVNKSSKERSFITKFHKRQLKAIRLKKILDTTKRAR